MELFSLEIEEFAKLLVEWVRDATIRINDTILPRALSGEHATPSSRRWKEAADSGSPEAFAKVLIADIVDDTIAHLLGAIDQDVLRLSFTATNGKSIDLATETDGLSGWYGGGGGWCEKYTKERFVDDLADLKGFFDRPSDADQI